MHRFVYGLLTLVALAAGCAYPRASAPLLYDSSCNKVKLSQIERNGQGYTFLVTAQSPSQIDGRASCFPHIGPCDHAKTDASVECVRLEEFGFSDYRVTIDPVQDGQYIFINVWPRCTCLGPLLFQQRGGQLYYKLWEFQCSDEHDAPVALN